MTINLWPQAFTEQTGISLTGVFNSSVAWGDYNNDGFLDILLTGTSDSGFVSKIYKNNGNSSFTEQTGISLIGVTTSSASWADYDNDGDLDILLTGWFTGSYMARIYQNNGNNTFTEQSNISLTGVSDGSSAWADYDNDGDLDLLVTGNGPLGQSPRIYRNNGDNSFAEETGISLPGVASGSVAWGDYDNDGYLDILMTGWTEAGRISKIYRNNGNNTFTEQTSITLTGVEMCSASWADYDNDGYLDILLAGNSVSGPVSKVYHNAGNDTFTEQTGILLTGVLLSSVAWGDYNNDGYQDILLTGESGAGRISKIYHNDGDNTFTEKTNISLTGVYRSSCAWGDYDNDGDLDILLTGQDEHENIISKIYRNDISVSNTKPSTPANLLASVNNGIVTFKWDKATDNQTPAAGLSYNLYVYESGQSNYECTPHSFRQSDALNGKRLISKIGNIQWNAKEYILKDLPPDKTYYWSVQAIDGGFLGSNFAAEQSFTVPLFRPHEQANCINVTNIQDNQITATWAGGGGTKRAVFIKQGTSGTADPVDNNTYTIGGYTPSGWKCIYNGTECTTIITGIMVNTDYVVQVSEYNGTPGNEKYLTTTDVKNPAAFNTIFTEQPGIALSPATNTSASWGDYDNDGFLDILLTGFSYSDGCRSRVYRNNGNNTFTEQSGIELTGVTYSSAAWGDYNNDDYLDILLTGLYWATPGPVLNSRIYKNNRDNTFIEQTGISLTNINAGSVAWGDYDKDGYLDFLLTGNTGSGYISKIYHNNRDSTFTEQTGISLTGVYISSAAWGDYDNDGYADILLTGASGSGPVSKIYRNNGNNTFTEQTDIVLQSVQTSSVAWSDCDNDGYLDILLTGSNLTNFSKIYHNNGNNTFTDQTEISLISVSSGSATWGDYDNDGDPDVLLTGNSSSGSVTKIYCNNGDNTFTEQTNILLTGVSGSSVAWGDYDNDGDLDILITGQETINNFISKVYKNNCTKINKNPDQPKNLSYRINNKNALLKWDRVTSDETSSKSITYNIRVGRKSGSSEFVSPQAASNGFRRVAAMGNNQLDTTFTFKNLRWDTTYYASVQAIDNSFKGGTFSNEVQFKINPVQSSRLSANHINNSSLLLRWKRGNGDRCIILAKEGTSGTASPQNNTTYYANPEFSEGSPLGPTGWYCIYKGEADSVLLAGLNPQKNYLIHVIEFQGKNGSEIYAPTVTSENIGVFSTGLFTEQINIPITGVQLGSVAWGDYDNDGFLDFLLTGQNTGGSGITKIYRNNGNNTFTEQTGISLTGVFKSSVAWGDYNNKGYLDILLTGATGSNYISKIYHNNGNNTFTEQTSISMSNVTNGSVAWGDYDSDGYLDILLTGYSGSSGISKVYRNNGDNTFTEQTTISLAGVQFSSVAWCDYDTDGYLDILLTGSNANYPNYNPITKIYHNNGDNTFTPLTGIPLRGLYSGSVTWCDYNNDGNQDIFLTGFSHSTWTGISKIYKNDGNNSFTEQIDISLTGVYLSSAAWGDYDNDGDPDILLTGTAKNWPNYNPVSKIFHNNGDNTFSEQTGISLTGIYNSSVAWGDCDNDGDIDILLTGIDENGNAISKIFYSNLIMKVGTIKPNVSPNAPTGLTCTFTPGNIKLSWSQVTDDETPAKTMSYNLRYKLKEATQWKFAPHSSNNGYRLVPAMGNVQLNKCFNLKNLPSGTYCWQVQAVDQGFAGGAWSVVDSFIVKNTQAFFKTDTVCLGLPTHFTDQSVATDGIDSWEWDFKDGMISHEQNPVHTYSLSGTYDVKLVITDETGGKDSLEKEIFIKSSPVAGFTSPFTCQGIPVNITNTTNNNGLNIISWYWDFGDGQNSAIQQPAPHGYLNAGDYQVKLKATASNGCADSVFKNVKVANYPVAEITTNSPLNFCEGGNVTLSVQYIDNYLYQWMIDGTPLTNGDSCQFESRFSGSYSVAVVNINGNCKTTSLPVNVSVKPFPSKPVIKSDNYHSGMCPGEIPVKLKVSDIVTGYNYVWYRNGIPLGVNASSYLEGILSEGDYSVEADMNGCKSASEIFSVYYEVAPKKPDLYVRGPVVWYMAVSNDTASSYNWYLNNEIIPGAVKFIYVANKTLGTYKAAIRNEYGCRTFSDEITIPVSKSGITDFVVPAEFLLKDADPFASLKIYPNPTPGLFTIEMDNNIFGDLDISVLTQAGKEILKIKFEKTTEHFLSQVDLSGQSKGLYIINLLIEKYFASRKLIVE